MCFPKISSVQEVFADTALTKCIIAQKLPNIDTQMPHSCVVGVVESIHCTCTLGVSIIFNYIESNEKSLQ